MITPAQMGEARALITPIENWCRDDFAQDHDGDGVHPTSPNAVRFCAYGAIAKVMGFEHGSDAWYELPWKTWGDLAHTNNRFGHEAVLNVMDDIANTLDTHQ